jgi:hypothetical protein
VRKRLGAASRSASKVPYADRGDLGEASVGSVCRACGRGRRRGVDVLAVDILGIANEGGALLAAGVALLKAVELEFWRCPLAKASPSALVACARQGARERTY